MQDADTSAAVDPGTSFEAAFSAPEPAPAGDDGGGDEGGDGGQPRDPHGRFAPKEQADPEPAAPQPVPKPEPERDHRIPIRELLDERDRRQAAERELEAFRRQQRMQREAEQAPQRPDPLQDPDAYADFVESTIVGGRVKTIEQQIQDRFVDMTFEAQADVLGKDVFDPMVDAFIAASGPGGSRDPQLFQSVVKASNPGAALVRWHKRHAAMSEIGDDPDGFINRKLEEKLKDPEVRKRILAEADAEARGVPAGRSDTITALPSLNRAPGSAGGQRPGSLGDTGEERFENAFGRRKRA